MLYIHAVLRLCNVRTSAGFKFECRGMSAIALSTSCFRPRDPADCMYWHRDAVCAVANRQSPLKISLVAPGGRVDATGIVRVQPRGFVESSGRVILPCPAHLRLEKAAPFWC